MSFGQDISDDDANSADEYFNLNQVLQNPSVDQDPFAVCEHFDLQQEPLETCSEQYVKDEDLTEDVNKKESEISEKEFNSDRSVDYSVQGNATHCSIHLDNPRDSLVHSTELYRPSRCPIKQALPQSTLVSVSFRQDISNDDADSSDEYFKLNQILRNPSVDQDPFAVCQHFDLQQEPQETCSEQCVKVEYLTEDVNKKESEISEKEFNSDISVDYSVHGDAAQCSIPLDNPRGSLVHSTEPSRPPLCPSEQALPQSVLVLRKPSVDQDPFAMCEHVDLKQEPLETCSEQYVKVENVNKKESEISEKEFDYSVHGDATHCSVPLDNPRGSLVYSTEPSRPPLCPSEQALPQSVLMDIFSAQEQDALPVPSKHNYKFRLVKKTHNLLTKINDCKKLHLKTDSYRELATCQPNRNLSIGNQPLGLKCTKQCRINIGNKTFQCGTCCKAFNSKYDLTRHCKIHTGYKPFQCATCGKAFSDKSDLTRHCRMHTGSQPFQCATCNKAFSNKSNLSKHCTIHTGYKPFQCATCSKSFNDNSDLTRHCRIHTGYKPFQCATCGKTFSDMYNLSKHCTVHTGYKPYQCITCSKSFSDKSDLRRHCRIHTGNKPFQCATCGKAFNDMSNLSKHCTIHTGYKPYQCITCSKSFSDKSDLTRHCRRHTGYKPFQCATCSKSFSDKSDLTKHCRIHTGSF